jgi:hypothetical protein
MEILPSGKAVDGVKKWGASNPHEPDSIDPDFDLTGTKQENK